MSIDSKIKTKILSKMWEVIVEALFSCTTSLLAKYDGATSNDKLLDVAATGNYEVEPADSWLADGLTYGTCSFSDPVNKEISVMANVSTSAAGEDMAFWSFGFLNARLFKPPTDEFSVNDVGTGIDATPYFGSPHKYTLITEPNGTVTQFLIDDVEVWSGVAAEETTGYFCIGARWASWDQYNRLFIGNMWDFTITDRSTGEVVFSNFLGQDSTSMLMKSEVGPDVQFVDGTLPIVEGSIEQGHEWSKYTVDTDGSKIPEDPSNLGYDVDGNLLTNSGSPQKNIKITGYVGTFNGTTYLSAPHLTGTEGITSYIGTATPTVSAGRIDFTAGWCKQVVLDEGTTLIIESHPTSTQDTVYNNIGSNHATIENFTPPFFTTEAEGSKLFEDGFELSGDNYIPSGVSSTLTNEPGEFKGDYCLFSAPLSHKFYNAAVEGSIEDSLYTGESAVDLTANEWIALMATPFFFSDVTNELNVCGSEEEEDTEEPEVPEEPEEPEVPNTAPTAINDAVTGVENAALVSSVSLTANDTDPEDDTLTVIAGTFATTQGGSLVLSSDGSYTYTPATDFVGTDTVNYTVTDGEFTDIGTLTITVIEFIEGGDAVTTMRSSVVKDDITWTLNGSYPVGQFVTGDYFVVAPSGLSVTGITATGPEDLGGTQKNPKPIFSQGLTSRGSDQCFYDSALNVGLNLPISLAAGDNIVTATMQSDLALKTDLEQAAVLTVVASTPTATAFRPGVSDDDATIYDSANIDWSMLQSILPTNEVADLATIGALWERPWIDFYPSWSSRTIHPKNNMSAYGGTVAADISVTALLINSQYTQAQKKPIVLGMIQYGIDVQSHISYRYSTYSMAVAHQSGRKFPWMLAGELLDINGFQIRFPRAGAYVHTGTNGDAPGDSIRFEEDMVCTYVTQRDVDQTVAGTSHFTPDENYTTAMIGMPEWFHHRAEDRGQDSADWRADLYRRAYYMGVQYGNALSVYMMGWETLWNHPAFFDYLDRYTAIETGTAHSYPTVPSEQTGTRNDRWSGLCVNAWDKYRGNY